MPPQHDLEGNSIAFTAHHGKQVLDGGLPLWEGGGGARAMRLVSPLQRASATLGGGTKPLGGCAARLQRGCGGAAGVPLIRCAQARVKTSSCLAVKRRRGAAQRRSRCKALAAAGGLSQTPAVAPRGPARRAGGRGGGGVGRERREMASPAKPRLAGGDARERRAPEGPIRSEEPDSCRSCRGQSAPGAEGLRKRRSGMCKGPSLGRGRGQGWGVGLGGSVRGGRALSRPPAAGRHAPPLGRGPLRRGGEGMRLGHERACARCGGPLPRQEGARGRRFERERRRKRKEGQKLAPRPPPPPQQLLQQRQCGCAGPGSHGGRRRKPDGPGAAPHLAFAAAAALAARYAAFSRSAWSISSRIA
jgi:hypothetical protein